MFNDVICNMQENRPADANYIKKGQQEGGVETGSMYMQYVQGI